MPKERKKAAVNLQFGARLKSCLFPVNS